MKAWFQRAHKFLYDRWRWLYFAIRGKRKCQEYGCPYLGAVRCELYDYDAKKELIDFYCPSHARENGFCWGCGQFWAGCEEFEFSPIPGCCPNCRDEFEEPEEEEEFYYNPEEDVR